MTDTLIFLAAPFCMCLILVGIHCYLGLHVLARGVIFVDLALAQVAAFGTVFAFILGYEHEDIRSYLISLVATQLAALYLAFANKHKKRIQQEALIGVLYACFSAMVVLLLDKASHGHEHLKYALVGQLLWVSWADVLQVSIIYGVVASLHYYFRHALIKQSFEGGQHWKWDFLFYALFGIVITSSVHVAGVLLVFAFLIVPAILSSLFYQTIKARLIFGWLMGLVLSLIGMNLSYFLDLPAGAVIVTVFTLAPLLTVFKLKRT
jgi:zinc/manganese transport system permease protein